MRKVAQRSTVRKSEVKERKEAGRDDSGVQSERSRQGKCVRER